MGEQKTLAQAVIRQGSRTSSAAGAKSASPAQRVGNGNLALLVHLEELARDPRQAHVEWRRLDLAQKLAVAERMRRHFGARFTRRFLMAARIGNATPEVRYYQLGYGPTAQELRAQGFVRAGTEINGRPEVDIDWWFNPKGVLVRHTRAATEIPVANEEEDDKDRGKTPDPQLKSPQPHLLVIDLQGYTPAQLLRILEKGLDDLQAYCAEDWFEDTDADLDEIARFAREVDAQQFKVTATFAKLRSELAKPDARSVSPAFRRRMAAAEQRHAAVRRLCCKNIGGPFGCVPDDAPQAP